MTRAPVNRILPYSLVDGPGLRVAVFLQGCNLRCAYCHNPETQSLCTHCGICVPVCPSGALRLHQERVIWDESLCTHCDACLIACPHSASPKVTMMTAQEAYDRVRESLPFARGITVSGGECTLNPAFLQELFTLARAEGLHCLIDSNGAVALAQYPALLDVCDGVMLDVKAWDPQRFYALTGGCVETAKENLRFLSACDKLAEVRLVCLPNEVDCTAVIEGIAQTLGRDAVKQLPLKLIAFRSHGVRGRLARTSSPPHAFLESLAQLARDCGFETIILL